MLICAVYNDALSLYLCSLSVCRALFLSISVSVYVECLRPVAVPSLFCLCIASTTECMHCMYVCACEYTGFIFICLSHTRMHNYTCCRTSSHRILTIFNMRCCHRHLWPRYSTRARARTHTKDIPGAAAGATCSLKAHSGKSAV